MGGILTYFQIKSRKKEKSRHRFLRFKQIFTDFLILFHHEGHEEKKATTDFADFADFFLIGSALEGASGNYQ